MNIMMNNPLKSNRLNLEITYNSTIQQNDFLCNRSFIPCVMFNQVYFTKEAKKKKEKKRRHVTFTKYKLHIKKNPSGSRQGGRTWRQQPEAVGVRRRMPSFPLSSCAHRDGELKRELLLKDGNSSNTEELKGNKQTRRVRTVQDCLR